MIRIFLSTIFPLLLPVALYYFWLVAYNARKQSAVGKGKAAEAAAERAPWLWLLIAGVVLMLVTLAGLSFWGGAPASSRYIPPHMEGGDLVPGRMIPP